MSKEIFTHTGACIPQAGRCHTLALRTAAEGLRGLGILAAIEPWEGGQGVQR